MEPTIEEIIEITFRRPKFNAPVWTTGDGYKRIKIPLVRRIYPQLIANKIVSTQPLLGPTGLVYYLRYRYSENKGVRSSTLDSELQCEKAPYECR